MTTMLPNTGPLPVLTQAEVHPDWCDPRVCTVTDKPDHGLTEYLHRVVLLEEPHPYKGEEPLLVDVYRQDYRDSGGALVDEYARPAELATARVYIRGLDDIERDAGQARRLAEALAQAAAVVAGRVAR